MHRFPINTLMISKKGDESIKYITSAFTKRIYTSTHTHTQKHQKTQTHIFTGRTE